MEKGQEYLDKLLAEIKQIEADIVRIKAETEKTKRKNEAIRKQIEEVKVENRILLRERGWEGITDEEMKWVMSHSSEYYFKLRLSDIRRLIAQENENIS